MGSPILHYEHLHLRPSLGAALFLPALFGSIVALLCLSLDVRWPLSAAWVALSVVLGSAIAMTQYGSVQLLDGALTWRSGLRHGTLSATELDGIEVFYPDMHPARFLPLGALYAPPTKNKPQARPDKDMATTMTLGTDPPIRISLQLISRRRRQEFLEHLEDRLVPVRHGDDSGPGT